MKKKHTLSSTTVSIKGTLVDSSSIRLEDIHFHKGINRDIFTYAGLIAVSIVWILPLMSKIMM